MNPGPAHRCWGTAIHWEHVKTHRAIGIACIAAAVACSSSPELAQIDHTPRVEVVAAHAAPDTVQRTLRGILAPLRDATLSAQLGGAVVERPVDIGASVGTGTPLLKLDAREARAGLRLAAAQVAEARAAADDANRSLSRIETLGDGASTAQRESAQAAADRAAAMHASAVANQDLATVRLDHMTLRAPFDGQLSWVGPEIGEMIGPGTPVVRMVDVSAYKVTVGLTHDERVAAEAPNSQFELLIRDRRVAAERRSVAIAADPRTLDWAVELVVLAEPELVAGMPVTVAASLAAAPEAVSVPVAAVHNKTVMVVSENVLRHVDIEVVGEDAGALFVRGVNSGDQVVVRGARGLADGTAVVVLENEG